MPLVISFNTGRKNGQERSRRPFRVSFSYGSSHILFLAYFVTDQKRFICPALVDPDYTSEGLAYVRHIRSKELLKVAQVLIQLSSEGGAFRQGNALYAMNEFLERQSPQHMEFMITLTKRVSIHIRSLSFLTLNMNDSHHLP